MDFWFELIEEYYTLRELRDPEKSLGGPYLLSIYSIKLSLLKRFSIFNFSSCMTIEYYSRSEKESKIGRNINRDE